MRRSKTELPVSECPKDPETLAGALEILINSKEKREKMGVQAHSFVEKYFNQAILLKQILEEKEAKL